MLTFILILSVHNLTTVSDRGREIVQIMNNSSQDAAACEYEDVEKVKYIP